jgi:cyanuric acid amidohydrolase
MQPNSFDVIRIPTHGPGDVSGLVALIDSGALEPSSILAVLGKTEGNGGVNDFTREYAVAALCNALSPHLKLAPREVEARIAFVMSGGTEGVLSPHITVFARSLRPESIGENPSEKRLSVGIAHTRDFLPEEMAAMRRLRRRRTLFVRRCVTLTSRPSATCISSKSNVRC